MLRDNKGYRIIFIDAAGPIELERHEMYRARHLHLLTIHSYGCKQQNSVPEDLDVGSRLVVEHVSQLFFATRNFAVKIYLWLRDISIGPTGNLSPRGMYIIAVVSRDLLVLYYEAYIR